MVIENSTNIPIGFVILEFGVVFSQKSHAIVEEMHTGD
jgi:hypothetical protein